MHRSSLPQDSPLKWYFGHRAWTSIADERILKQGRTQEIVRSFFHDLISLATTRWVMEFLFQQTARQG
jgi:hypothetical protein